MKTHKLSRPQHSFFSLVARASWSNPFSDQRNQLDCEITSMPRSTSRRKVIERVISLVSGNLAELDRGGHASLDQFSGDDRRVFGYAALFDIYHRLVGQMDALIEQQAASGEPVGRVTFAHEALASLSKRGYDEPSALRYFAIFYQMRRAFYFIERTLLGGSPCMKSLRRSLWDNVFTHDIRWYETVLWNRMEDFSTLLLGETGTGKGTAAAAIGRSGFIPFDAKRLCFAESFTKSFLQINLSQYTESLIESELFGHRKGAFTGAVESHDGALSLCSPHGTIFLDEIGDVSVPVQIKLLQVLQDRVYSPVGSHEKRRFQGRIIAATNKPLEDLRRHGQFRDDFYYRLCSGFITVPTLRQRIQEEPGEFGLLIEHALRRMTGTAMPELGAFVKSAIISELGPDYPWPGNVRELEQCVRQVLLTASAQADFRSKPADLLASIAQGINAESYDAESLMADYARLLYQRHGTYQDVARITKLDRRTAKKHVKAR